MIPQKYLAMCRNFDSVVPIAVCERPTVCMQFWYQCVDPVYFQWQVDEKDDEGQDEKSEESRAGGRR